MEETMRRWMTGCILALAAAACGDPPELRAPERALELNAFLAAPAAEAPAAAADSALAAPPPLAVVTPVAPPADERCNPNYRPCVPVDSDVDCVGGGGNGPSYVLGPVEV